jgi:hypothetical protein
MPVPGHFQMGVIPMENWILVNFLYIFNMLLAETEGGWYSNKTMFINVLVKWFKKQKYILYLRNFQLVNFR